MHTLHGSCHCGRLTVNYSSPVKPGEIKVRVCQCTFCKRHGGRYTSHACARLEIIAESDNDMNRYRFGTATADFLMCAHCGVVMAAVSDIEGKHCAVVNTSVFEDFSVPESNVSEHDFDGEDLEFRLQRRKRNWTPNVSISIRE